MLRNRLKFCINQRNEWGSSPLYKLVFDSLSRQLLYFFWSFILESSGAVVNYSCVLPFVSDCVLCVL